MFDTSKWLFFFKCSEFCSTVSVLVAISWRNFRLKTFDDIISSPSSIFSAYDSNARAQNGERLFFYDIFAVVADVDDVAVVADVDDVADGAFIECMSLFLSYSNSNALSKLFELEW